MDSARTYAQHFLESNALRMTTPFIMRLSQGWIKQALSARPELVDAFRAVAREALRSDSEESIRKATVVLSVVGEAVDVALLEQLLGHPAKAVVRDAGTALFELRRALG